MNLRKVWKCEEKGRNAFSFSFSPTAQGVTEVGSEDELVKGKSYSFKLSPTTGIRPRTCERVLVVLGLIILLSGEGQLKLPCVTNNTWHLSICHASSHPR